MDKRVFIDATGGVSVTSFAAKARRPDEPVRDFMDRISAKFPWNNLPHIDIQPDALPPRTRPDGTCGRCRWRVVGNAVVIRPSAPCTCGKDEYLAIKAKIESTDQATAIQGLLELERFKIRQQEKTNGLNPAPNPQPVTATGDGSPPA